MARRKRTKKKKRKRRPSGRSIAPYYDYNRQEPHFLGRDYSKFSVIHQMNQQRQELEAAESLKRWVGRKQFYNLVKLQSSLQQAVQPPLIHYHSPFVCSALFWN